MIFRFPIRAQSIHSLKVAGRLQFFIQNSQLITQDPWVLQAISGLRSRTAGSPLAVQNPFSPGIVTHRFPSGGGRDKKSSTKMSYFRGTFYLQQSISCGKEGRSGQRPVINLANFNKFVTYLLRPGDFMHVQTGPEGCIFHHPSPCQASEIHPLSIRRENLSIQLSPIRANISPSHFHQGSQTNCGHAKKNGCPDDSLFERHAHYEEHLTAC